MLQKNNNNTRARGNNLDLIFLGVEHGVQHKKMKIFQHHWLGKKATTAQQDCHRNSYHSPSSPVRSVSHTLFSLLFSLSLSFSSPPLSLYHSLIHTIHLPFSTFPTSSPPPSPSAFSHLEFLAFHHTFFLFVLSAFYFSEHHLLPASFCSTPPYSFPLFLICQSL